jgi:hypothetical protein
MIINHKNVLNGLYDFTISGDEIVVDIKTNYSFVHQFEDYNRFIKEYGYNMTKINIITALIWLNMSPLYSGKFQQFLFYFGKYHLARALKDI